MHFVVELFLDLSSPSSNNRQYDQTNIELYTGDRVLLALPRHSRSVSSGTPLQVSLQWHAIAGQSPVARHCRSVSCGTPLQVSLLWHAISGQSPVARHFRSVSCGTPFQVSLRWHAIAGQSPVARQCRSVSCGTPLQVTLLTKDSVRSSSPVLLYVHRDHKNY